MTNRERKINDCYHISNFIEILSKYFKLSEPYMEKSTLDFVRNERYMLIKTDIEMNVKYFDDRLVNEITLKTWNNGFGQQSYIHIDYCSGMGYRLTLSYPELREKYFYHPIKKDDVLKEIFNFYMKIYPEHKNKFRSYIPNEILD